MNGNDAGVYDITSVSGASLFVAATMRQTASPLQYRILRQQDSGIELPLVRVKAVEILDASLEPTGDFVPYRHPIDVQSRNFQNPGRGAKAGTRVVVTNDKLAVNPGVAPRRLTSNNTSINYYALGVRPGDIVNIDTGDNTGYYVVASGGVGGSPAAPGINDYELLVTSDLTWVDADMSYAVGEPSYGSFRLYFLEPVSVSVRGDTTWVSVRLGDGTVRRFRPDPSLWDEYFPTSVTTPTLSVTAGNPSVDLYSIGGAATLNTAYYGVEAEDRVEITFAPIVGSLDLGAGSHAVDGLTLLLDLGNGPERIRFSGNLNIDDIISQVNSKASRAVAAKWESGGAKYFVLKSNQSVVLLDNSVDGDDATAIIFGITPATHNPWLTAATFAGETISNDSPYKGYWYAGGVAAAAVALVDDSGVAFNPTWNVGSALGHYAVFSRAGRQSIKAPAMNQQQDEYGLYYFDIECVSEGYGDTWNIDADQQGAISGYDSDGWSVSTEDTDFSFSMAERPWLHVTPRLLLVGSDDDPSNYEELVGRSFQITYDRDPIVEEVHAFVRDQQQRVVCESPLARALLPIFVRTSIFYRDGDAVIDTRAGIVDVIRKVLPEQYLEVSDIIDVVMRGGANYVQLPITVIGVAHNRDRTVFAARSKDLISTGRLSALIPDDDGASVEGASWIQLTRG